MDVKSLDSLTSTINQLANLPLPVQQNTAGTTATQDNSTSNATVQFSPDAQNLQSLGIVPSSIQTQVTPSSFNFSASQSLGNLQLNSNGSVDFQAQQLSVNVTVNTVNTANGNGTTTNGTVQGLTFSLNVNGITQGTTPNTPAVQASDLDKEVQAILDDIQQELQQNPNQDPTQAALDVMRKHLQPLFDIMRHMIDFVFRLGNAQAGGAQTPYDQAKGTPTLNYPGDASYSAQFAVQNVTVGLTGSGGTAPAGAPTAPSTDIRTATTAPVPTGVTLSTKV